MSVEFRVYGRPVSKGSWKNVGQGRAIASNRDRMKVWEYEVAQAARAAFAEIPMWATDSPMVVEMMFFLARPKGHFGRNGDIKPSSPRFYTKIPDLDKIVRSTLDALTNAGVWEDDAQVMSLNATKAYTSNMRNQGVLISVTRLED